MHSLAEAAGEYGTLIRVLAYTGLRWGDVTGLRVKDIDLGRARLKVVQNVVPVNGEVMVGTPKTHKRRSVPVPPFVMHLLAEAIGGKQQIDLLFADAAGCHLRNAIEAEACPSTFWIALTFAPAATARDAAV